MHNVGVAVVDRIDRLTIHIQRRALTAWTPTEANTTPSSSQER